MALKYQKYVDLPDGTMLGIHIFEPTTTSHTITVPEIAERTTSTGASVAQLAKRSQTVLGTAPAMTADAYTIALTLTAAELATAANDEIIIVTNHRLRMGNFQREDATTPAL